MYRKRTKMTLKFAFVSHKKFQKCDGGVGDKKNLRLCTLITYRVYKYTHTRIPCTRTHGRAPISMYYNIIYMYACPVDFWPLYTYANKRHDDLGV